MAFERRTEFSITLKAVMLIAFFAGLWGSIVLARALFSEELLIVAPGDSFYQDGRVIDVYMAPGVYETVRMRKLFVFVWYEDVPNRPSSVSPSGSKP